MSQAELAVLLDNASQVIVHSFGWLNVEAQAALDGLEKHLKQTDAPPLVDQLIKSALRVALGAGAAAAGELIAGKLLPHLVEEVAEMAPIRELVKGLFEQGIHAGVEAGVVAVGGSGSTAIEAFIGSQKAAVVAAQVQNQTHWIDVGRYELRTVGAAKALREACSRANMQVAGQRQYAATRDAWIAYLAQSKLGSVERTIDRGEGPVRTKVTNMSTKEQSTNVLPAAYGLAPGVLEVVAELPEINLEKKSMNGKPKVRMALLNGVNSTIREQYAGQPLSAMKIPRHIVGRSPHDEFAITVDEAGNVGGLDGPHTWLRSRAFVSKGANATWGDDDRLDAGVSLLLEELIPGQIKEKL